MESQSVRSVVGKHTGNLCNNPESELRDDIYKSLDTGILRLEFIIYRYNVQNKIIKHKSYKFYKEVDYIEDTEEISNVLEEADGLFTEYYISISHIL